MLREGEGALGGLSLARAGSRGKTVAGNSQFRICL